MVVETVIDECRNIVNKITILVYDDYWHLKGFKTALMGLFFHKRWSRCLSPFKMSPFKIVHCGKNVLEVCFYITYRGTNNHLGMLHTLTLILLLSFIISWMIHSIMSYWLWLLWNEVYFYLSLIQAINGASNTHYFHFAAIIAACFPPFMAVVSR